MHEAISDAARMPFPDEVSGELPRTYVILQENENKLTEEKISKCAMERFAPYKRLDGNIVFTGVIPESTVKPGRFYKTYF
jgi:4-coumarate--CoA ligase